MVTAPLRVGSDGTVSGNGTMGPLQCLGGVVAPGSSIGTLTSSSYQQNGSTAKLQIELASNTSYDNLAVTGRLNLPSGSILGSGALEVSLASGYVPSGTRSFDILDWGTLTGSFNSIILPTLGGTLSWNTSQLYTTGVITVTGPAATLTADFEEDGDVDTNDFMRWRSGFGTGLAHTQGNADGDGDVDGADFLIWQRQLGMSRANATTKAVPEATSLELVIAVGLVANVLARRRP